SHGKEFPSYVFSPPYSQFASIIDLYPFEILTGATGMEATQVLSPINSIALFFQQGGIFMWIILFVWAVGIAIAIERFMRLSFKLDVDGASFMNELQRYVLSNDIQGAIRVCSGSVAALPKVLKSGLKRASTDASQIQNAIDATAL